LLDDEALDALLSPIPGEVVANNRFSADAFVVAGDLPAAIAALETCDSDNAAPRRLSEAGFAWRDLGSTAWARFDDDTTLDRAFVEERGMRSARRGGTPRSLLAAFMERTSPAELIAELCGLGDAVVLDTRVLMAARAGSADAAAWPLEEERLASDFGDAGRVATPWLRELTEAAARAPVPVLRGGHALVSDGLRIIVRSAWQGR